MDRNTVTVIRFVTIWVAVGVAAYSFGGMKALGITAMVCAVIQLL